jgi:glyoxylase-like metal-dependent hydrolase (beta-lactamase superfamily II)
VIVRLGKVNLGPVSDGVYRLDGGGLFGLMPKVEWQEIAEPDELNRIRVEIRCLLIETGQQRILVDTGHGDKLSDREQAFMNLKGKRRLVASLAARGVRPEDVDMVINTHLHGDHCGGNTSYDESGELVATFPRAKHYVQRLELADATFPNERTRATYLRDNFQPLEESGQLCVLWGDTRLTDAVRVMLTPGHTPAHQSVVIESEGKTAVFLADAAHWPLHMEQLGVTTAYDVQPLVTIETRRRLARWAIENEVLLIFDHHPEIAAGYLHPTKHPDRFRVEPVAL